MKWHWSSHDEFLKYTTERSGLPCVDFEDRRRRNLFWRRGRFASTTYKVSLYKGQPDLRDVFLCHAWDDRKGAAKELHDLLADVGVKVWFSEKDLGLGVPMMRAIDKGLANSRIGLVSVTPAMLERLPKESVADKELSALLAGNLLIPIVHGTSYEALRNVSPLLASRTGLSTSQDSMAVVAAKLAELVEV